MISIIYLSEIPPGFLRTFVWHGAAVLPKIKSSLLRLLKYVEIDELRRGWVDGGLLPVLGATVRH